MNPYSITESTGRALATMLFATWASLLGAQTLTPVRFQHDWRIDGTVAIYQLAQAKGYFTQEGLAVTIDQGTGSAATVNRIASGTYDIGQGDVLSFMEAASSNVELRGRMKVVFQLWDEAPAAVITLKKSGIRTPTDLRGKKIAAPLFDGGRKLFPLLAKANKLDAEKDVTWMTVDPSLREQMLVRGEADAITAYVFAITNLNRLGTKDDDITVIRYSDFGVRVPGTAILASTAFAKAHPEAVKGFLRAISRALKDSIADPATAIRLVKQREPLIDEVLELKRLKLIIADGYGSKQARASGIGMIDKVAFEKSIDDISTAYGLKSPPRFDEIFDFQFLPTKEARMVFGKP